MIKIRAWDKVNNKMWYGGQEGESVGDWTFQSYFNKDGHLEAVIVGNEFMVTDDPFPMYEHDIKTLDIMQFTGLKDSVAENEHPMEIYEGDIMFHPVSGEYFIVTRDEHYANFFLKNRERNPLSYDDYDFAEMDGENIFVVGNLYQNPELLEVE